MAKGARKRILNPQQEKFLQLYLDPKSETWGNLRQSALSVGFSAEYADNIGSLLPKWLQEGMNDNALVQKALDNLSDFIGNKKLPTYRWDATKFVLSTLGKNKFSTRQEVTGKDGAPLVSDPETKRRTDEAIRRHIEKQKG